MRASEKFKVLVALRHSSGRSSEYDTDCSFYGTSIEEAAGRARRMIPHLPKGYGQKARVLFSDGLVLVLYPFMWDEDQKDYVSLI